MGGRGWAGDKSPQNTTVDFDTSSSRNLYYVLDPVWVGGTTYKWLRVIKNTMLD
jgi:hypothetical protein